MVARTTDAYMAWKGVQKPCTGRYVRIRAKSPSAAVTEMVLYGEAKGPVEPLPNPVAPPKPAMGELMGVNGFVDDDPDLLAVVGNLREYHSWQWDDGNGDPKTPAYPDNRFGWSPSWVRGRFGGPPARLVRRQGRGGLPDRRQEGRPGGEGPAAGAGPGVRALRREGRPAEGETAFAD